MAKKLSPLQPLRVANDEPETKPATGASEADPFAAIRRPKAQARIQNKVMAYPSDQELEEIKHLAQVYDVSMSGILMMAYREWRDRNRDKLA